MPKFGDLKWVMFQFPSNTRLCEAIHILLVIKLLLGVNYHHHAPPLLLYRLRSEVHPTAHPLQNTRTYKHGGRNCNFLYFENEMINNKARHNLINAKSRWHSDWLNGAGIFWELLGQTQELQIRQRETPSHQGAITHEICCLSCQLFM